MVPPSYTIRTFCLTNCIVLVYQAHNALHVKNFKRPVLFIHFVYYEKHNSYQLFTPYDRFKQLRTKQANKRKYRRRLRRMRSHLRICQVI